MGSLMLRKVITARELLAAVGAFEWLLMGMERSVVALEVFLATEATRAQGANKGLGRILSKGLLTASAADRLRSGWSVSFI